VWLWLSAYQHQEKLMNNIFSNISLKRIFSLFTISTTVFLFIVIIFAGKQYFLYRQCETLVDSSQQLLFQFTGIKEHINETLLNRKSLNSHELIKEIQGLDIELKSLLEDILIPEEFKLSFISQVDLVNITVALRNIQNNDDNPRIEKVTGLSTQLRNIHSKLNSFNLLISRYTQKQLLTLHQEFVGLLSIVIALVSIMLLILNKYITAPIIHYCRNLFPKESDNISLFTLHKTIEKLATESTEKPPNPDEIETKELSRLYRYSSIGNLLGGLSHELSNLSNGIINYTQAILDISKDMRLEDNYIQLQHNLFKEEKKMSQLLTSMSTFASGSLTGKAKILSVDEIFEQVATLTRNTFKNDGIELTVLLNNPTIMLNNHVSDLQLVILSALQNSRIALNNRFTNKIPGQKEIRLSFDDSAMNTHNVSVIIEDNGDSRGTHQSESINASKGSWNNMQFCKAFLRTFYGSLNVTRTEDNTKNRCIITFPSES